MKTQTLLNIGLARNGRKDLNSAEVINLLDECFDQSVLDFAVHQSKTEKTLVVLVPTAKVPDDIVYALSVVLGQDCIAAVDDGKSGRLCGPKAADWSPFNPSYFLDLKGASL